MFQTDDHRRILAKGRYSCHLSIPKMSFVMFVTKINDFPKEIFADVFLAFE